MIRVHPTAIIEDDVRLDDGCVIHAHAIVKRYCELGEGVVVHPFAVVGGDPQDLSFDVGKRTGVRIGARTVIREHVTISRATKDDGFTEIGTDCFLMAASHVAHDGRLGNHVILANAVLLAGHVQIGDRAFLGGGAMVHQFCRIGESAMVGGGARISLDIAPFCMVAERNAIAGLNVVGLRRRGIKGEAVSELKCVFRLLTTPSGNLRELAASSLEKGEFHSAQARTFLEFLQSGRRPVARLHRAAATQDEQEG